MCSLCEAACVAGRWGFWCEAYTEADLLEAERNRETTSGLSLKHVHTLWHKPIISDLPKTRTFFALNPPPDGFRESWQINWVGHIECWPDALVCDQMLASSCRPETIIASGPILGTHGREIWLSVVEILPGRPLPLTTCCD